MPKFGKTSRANLATVHPDLQAIFNEVIRYQDCSITCGRRGKSEQDKLFREGKSKVQWPDSRHNVYDGRLVAMAVDAPPYPIDWNDLGRFYMFVGRVKQIADQMLESGVITHRLRCGADWDMDGSTDDQKFHDLPHFELME